MNALVNGVPWVYTPSGTSNRLQSVSINGSVLNFTYDQEGDTVAYGPGSPSQMFYYTGFNRLNGTYVNGLSTHFDVDAEGQRLHKYTADTDTYFAPGTNGAQLAEDQNGTWMDDVYLNGRLVTVMANGGVYPVASDQTGRPVALTHPTTKAVLWSTQSLPFGGGTVTNHWGGFNLGFPGQYYDSEDGLWHNGARDYDATLGRYIEADPLGLAGGVNDYVYVGGNPISLVDPLGLCPKCTKLQQQMAEAAEDANKVSEVTGNYAAVAGASAVGFEVAGGGPEDLFADLGAAASLKLAGTLESTSIVTALSAGALQTAASGGDFRYLGRAALLSTIGRVAAIANDVPGGAGTFVGRIVDSFANSVIPALPPPCSGDQ